MAPRLFALIIGIDMYKSGDIWNLESAAHDAKRLSRWLIRDLNVPREHVSMVLNEKATKQNIEANFSNHLINNPAIQRGDAILVYFAGHGSQMLAPAGWYDNDPDPSATVDVICTYDHDTKDNQGRRIVGISDRSLHALISDLASAKGNNITLMLDCCFSPIQSRSNVRDRSYTRWTATTKAKSQDLINGLWPTASKKHTNLSGFYKAKSTTHTTLVACSPGEKAMEGKNGGRFTFEFIKTARSVSLHHTTAEHLIAHIREVMAEGPQHPLAIGRNKSQIIFNAVPFTPDTLYLPVYLDEDSVLSIDAGLARGIFKGDQLAVHRHNYGGSHNPRVATLIVIDAQPTSSKCIPCPNSNPKLPRLDSGGYWVRIPQWNSRRSLSIHIKRTYVSFILRRKKSMAFPDVSQKLLSTPQRTGSLDTISKNAVVILERRVDPIDAARLKANINFRGLLSTPFLRFDMMPRRRASA